MEKGSITAKMADGRKVGKNGEKKSEKKMVSDSAMDSPSKMTGGHD